MGSNDIYPRVLNKLADTVAKLSIILKKLWLSGKWCPPWVNLRSSSLQRLIKCLIIKHTLLLTTIGEGILGNCYIIIVLI